MGCASIQDRYIDAYTFGYRWAPQWVREPELFTLPEYHALVAGEEGEEERWVPVAAGDVPQEVRRKLNEADFEPAGPHQPQPYTTPGDGCWAEPGPVAGSFEVVLGDGSTVRYAWYRFADQPALLSEAEREELQRRVELLHRTWTREREFLPGPARGELASLDGGLIVEPPAGLEVGYVPICTWQGWVEPRER